MKKALREHGMLNFIEELTKEVLGMGESKTIMSLFIFPNGIVAACDKEGQQIPEYQGEVGKVLLKALKALDEEGEVYLNYQGKLKESKVLG